VDILKKEAVAVVTGLMGIIYIAAAFGAPISPEQQKVMQEQLPGIIALLAVGGTITRQLVFSQNTVEDIAAKNVKAGFVAAKEGAMSAPKPTIQSPP
jgi:hypothetical protein